MTALLKAQKKIKPVTKSAENPYFKSKYADLNAILDAVTDALEEQNILLLQPTVTDGTSNYVTTRLQHVDSGEFIESTLKLELAKATMQELGSAVSYARRYTLQSLLTLQAQDDDANVASKTATPVAKKASFKKQEPAVTLGSTNGTSTTTPTVTDTWD